MNQNPTSSSVRSSGGAAATTPESVTVKLPPSDVTATEVGVAPQPTATAVATGAVPAVSSVGTDSVSAGKGASDGTGFGVDRSNVVVPGPASTETARWLTIAAAATATFLLIGGASLLLLKNATATPAGSSSKGIVVGSNAGVQATGGVEQSSAGASSGGSSSDSSGSSSGSRSGSQLPTSDYGQITSAHGIGEPYMVIKLNPYGNDGRSANVPARKYTVPIGAIEDPLGVTVTLEGTVVEITTDGTTVTKMALPAGG